MFGLSGFLALWGRVGIAIGAFQACIFCRALLAVGIGANQRFRTSRAGLLAVEGAGREGVARVTKESISRCNLVVRFVRGRRLKAYLHLRDVNKQCEF
jgi:hypothetical protein